MQSARSSSTVLRRASLDTVRQIGFLQIDPISTVASPQRLVLSSRLGPYDVAELDRLLWDEKKLFEWNAYIRPIEDLPLIRARMRRRTGKYVWERRGTEFLQTNAAYKHYVLKELECRGPLLSRELDDDSVRTWKSHGWYGSRNTSVMLDILHGRGVVAVVGRRNGQRLSGSCRALVPGDGERLTTRGRPAAREKTVPRARRTTHAKRLGGTSGHPDDPVPNRITFLSPFDRLIHDRDRAEALFDFRYRLEMYVPKAKRSHAPVTSSRRGRRRAQRPDARGHHRVRAPAPTRRATPTRTATGDGLQCRSVSLSVGKATG